MSILDYKSAATSSAARAATPATDRPEAKVWLNIGYDVETTDADGKPTTMFVNLPVGVPLDTMEPAKVTGQNEAFLQLRSAQNNLLKLLQEASDGLAAGEEKALTLIVKMRKRANPQAVANEDNPLAISAASLFA